MNNLERFLMIGEHLEPFNFQREHIAFIRDAVEGYEFTEQPMLLDRTLHLSFFAPEHEFGRIDARVESRTRNPYGIATDIRVQYGSVGSIAWVWTRIDAARGPDVYYGHLLKLNDEELHDVSEQHVLTNDLRAAYEKSMIAAIPATLTRIR